MLQNTHNVLCLDMERIFLRGIQDPARDFLKNCFLSKESIFSYRAQEDGAPAFAQLQFGERSAVFLYYISLPGTSPANSIESLCRIAGEAGKAHLLANAPMHSEQWQFLHAMGFHTYSVQNIWQVNDLPAARAFSGQWCIEKDQDRSAITSYYSHFLSPLELAFQTWNFPDIFHLILHDHSACVRGVARIRFFVDRAVILPMLDLRENDEGEDDCMIALLKECSRYFSKLFIRESTRHPINTNFFAKREEACLTEDHFMVRNLVAMNAIRNYQPLELLDEKGVAKPTTPFSHS